MPEGKALRHYFLYENRKGIIFKVWELLKIIAICKNN